LSKKFWGITIGILFSVALIIALFFTTMDRVVYGNMPADFVNEGIKYGVLDDVGISLEDFETVSEEMFEYLRDGREELADIMTTINGEPDTPFFNEKECLHMADCKKLFMGGYALWRASIAAALIALIVLILIFRKNVAATVHSIAVGLLAAAGVMTVGCITLGALVAKDFYKYFTLFHEIFFDNDLWLLDPTTDRLLMIMPTGYFVDCVTKIGLIFGVFMLVLLAAAVIWLVAEKRKHHEKGYPYNN